MGPSVESRCDRGRTGEGAATGLLLLPACVEEEEVGSTPLRSTPPPVVCVGVCVWLRMDRRMPIMQTPFTPFTPLSTHTCLRGAEEDGGGGALVPVLLGERGAAGVGIGEEGGGGGGGAVVVGGIAGKAVGEGGGGDEGGEGGVAPYLCVFGVEW